MVRARRDGSVRPGVRFPPTVRRIRRPAPAPRTSARRRGARAGWRRDTLACAPVTGGQSALRHRQPACACSFAGQTELREAAHAGRAVPQVPIAADVGRPAAAQVMAQDQRRPSGASMNHAPPRPPAVTGRARSPQIRRREPFRLDLPRALDVEQNRAVLAVFAAPVALHTGMASGFQWRRIRPSSESSKSRATVLPGTPRRHARSACCGCRRSATSPTSCRWCIPCARAWPGVAADMGHRQGRASAARRTAGRRVHRVRQAIRVSPACCALRRQLAGRRFDALLQMQVAARANLSVGLHPGRAPHRLRPARSKDLHGLFVNERIADRPGIHVLDAIGSFCEPLGLRQTEVAWDLPVPAEARDWARAQWPEDGRPTLVISPCSSHVVRNWRAERYAAVADHAASRGWRVVLCGGRSQLERDTTDAIVAAHVRSRAGPGRQGHAEAAARAARARRPGDDAGLGTACTSPTRWAPRCWACTRRAIPRAADRIRTAAIASIATTMPRAGTWASRRAD